MDANINFISLPANKYATVLPSNLDNDNPNEYFPSNVTLLENDTKLKYSAPTFISLPATGFRSSPFGGDGINPSETNANTQIFRTTIYKEISPNENENAFRANYSLGQQNELAFGNIPSENPNARISYQLPGTLLYRNK